MSKPTANFDGLDLATAVPGLIVNATNPYRPPKRDLNVAPMASSDKSVSSSAYYREKKLNVDVVIARDTRELLDDAVDTLKALLQDREAALILSVGSSTRQWTATYSNMTFSNVQGGYAEIDIEFTASDPMGIDVASTSLFSSSLTGATSNTPFVGGPLGGTAKWQLPVITITFNSLTMDGASDDVVVGNPLNSQQVTISRAWTSGDILVIDSKLKKVTVNGTEVAFTGSIPEWEKGVAGSMDYADTFSARNRTMTGLYYKRYA